MVYGGISPSTFHLSQEKVRANHVKLEQLPHNHECAFSDIIKMQRALKQADCAREENEPGQMKHTSPPPSYLLD